jgi:hypothetical protein
MHSNAPINKLILPGRLSGVGLGQSTDWRRPLWPVRPGARMIPPPDLMSVIEARIAANRRMVIELLLE